MQEPNKKKIKKNSFDRYLILQRPHIVITFQNVDNHLLQFSAGLPHQ